MLKIHDYAPPQKKEQKQKTNKQKSKEGKYFFHSTGKSISNF